MPQPSNTNSDIQSTKKLFGLAETRVSESMKMDRFTGLRVFRFWTSDAACQILTDSEAFGRTAYINKILKRNIGQGLLANEGEPWKKAHSHIVSFFTPREVSSKYTDIVLKEGKIFSLTMRPDGDLLVQPTLKG